MTTDNTTEPAAAGGPGAGTGGAPPGPGEVPGSPRWMRVALVVSLGLNLLVLGMVGGTVMRHGRFGDGRMVSEVGFGPFTDALSSEDRGALRDAFVSRSPNFRGMRSEARSDVATLIAALEADTWDAEAVREALAKQRDRTVTRIALGQDLLLERIGAMTPEARRAFAERLSGMMRHATDKDD